MTFTERQIQDYIWESRFEFSSMLAPSAGLDNLLFEVDIYNINPNHLIKNRILKKLQSTYRKLFDIQIIGKEVMLDQQANSTIRADFVSVFGGYNGIGIIELKRSIQTERQSFTELLAYSNHFTTLFPGMTRNDIVYVLIAPFETRICRDAFIQSLIFDNREIIGLIPSFTDDSNINSLHFELFVPSDRELAEFSKVAFDEANFNLVKIVWEHSEGEWNPPPGQSPNPGQIQKLNAMATLAAQRLEESGIHGFTFASQLWSELNQNLPYTNSLIVAGLNPYIVGRTQYAANPPANNPSGELDQDKPLTRMVPDLLRQVRECDLEFNDFELLESMWSEQLYRICKTTVDNSIMSIKDLHQHTEYGFFDWDEYRHQFFEHIACHNHRIYPTGLLKDLFIDITILDYDLANKHGVENHPIHGDMYFSAVDTLGSHNFFDSLIRRLMGDSDNA